MYSKISITTKFGTFAERHCDYYIQDNILTVYRKKEYKSILEGKTYYPFEAHYPMENVIEIKCIKVC